jgi:hypothetical protein
MSGKVMTQSEFNAECVRTKILAILEEHKDQLDPEVPGLYFAFKSFERVIRQVEDLSL